MVVEQHRQTIEDRVPSTHGDEDSVASENTHELNPAGSDEDNNSHDIIVEDSVSYTSKMSEGADQEDVSSKKSDCACLNTKSVRGTDFVIKIMAGRNVYYRE